MSTYDVPRGPRSGFTGHLLSDERLAIFSTMPKDTDGTVKDPNYLSGPRQAAYLEKWREWAKVTDKKHYPDWMNRMIAEKQYRTGKP